jgi:hypothetical protein
MNKIVSLKESSLAHLDRLPIAVRAYAAPPLPPDDEGQKKRQGAPASASEWTLIFDTETTVDAAQRLRIGAYQFRNRDELDEGGLFYDPAIISEEELSLLRRVAAERGLRLPATSPSATRPMSIWPTPRNRLPRLEIGRNSRRACKASKRPRETTPATAGFNCWRVGRQATWKSTPPPRHATSRHH